PALPIEMPNEYLKAITRRIGPISREPLLDRGVACRIEIAVIQRVHDEAFAQGPVVVRIEGLVEVRRYVPANVDRFSQAPARVLVNQLARCAVGQVAREK